MKFHTANLVPHYDDKDQWVSRDQFNSGDGSGPWIEYRMYSRYVRRTIRFALFYVGPEGEARWEHGGPVVKGARGALIPQPTMITDGPQAQPAQVVELSEGDMIMMNDQPMMVLDDRGQNYPELVTPEEFGERYPKAMARREQAVVKRVRV